MSARLRTPAGVRLTDLGAVWAAFSPLSGQTVLLNTEAAAILEILLEAPCDFAQLCETLAVDAQLSPDDVSARCADSWQQMQDAGLLEPAA